MTETIINLETVNPIEFFGVNNGKLDILKKKFPLLKILSRGTQLKLSGAPEQVENAREKIDLIVQYLERNGHMSENYFEQILGGDDAETVDNFIEKNPNDILVFGPNGKTIRARTVNQKRLAQVAEKNDIVFAIGPAGTGKTYTAVALAVRALKNKVVKKIILTRPAVEAGENLGFLPGDLKEKIDPYLRPLYDALDDMIPADKLGYYMSTRTIEIAPLAYMRGRTSIMHSLYWMKRRMLRIFRSKCSLPVSVQMQKQLLPVILHRLTFQEIRKVVWKKQFAFYRVWMALRILSWMRMMLYVTNW